MKISAFDARVGNLIEYRNKLWRVLSKNHVKPGKGGAFVQLEMKSLGDGIKLNERFRSEDKIEKARVEPRRMQYLYADGDAHVFMDVDNYEQLSLPSDELSAQTPFLLPNIEVQINFHNGAAIGVELPNVVTLSITETDGAIKGQTAAGGGKPAVCETGHRLVVPTFVETGERIKVNTETGEYIERA